MTTRACRATWAATCLMALAMGSRSALGLFLSPLNSATAIGVAAVNLAMAMAQLALGVGEIGRRVPASRRGLASGLVGAGGSAGQLFLALATQWVILDFGWQEALWATAALMLLALLYGTRAIAMELAYLAPLAPTAQLLGQTFGVQRLGTLMGAVMVAHQAGGFAGAWLGGWAVERSGSYQGLWLADVGLALVAAALQWPLSTKAPARAESASARHRWRRR